MHTISSGTSFTDVVMNCIPHAYVDACNIAGFKIKPSAFRAMHEVTAGYIIINGACVREEILDLVC